MKTKGYPVDILNFWQAKQLDIAVSEAILAEFEQVVFYEEVRERIAHSDEEVQARLDSFRVHALIVPGVITVPDLKRDPSDTMFLACAVEAQAEALVSRDNDLLELGSFRNIPIMEPREFVTRFAPQQKAA